MNREWHGTHVLGRNASLDERVAWHAEHARQCRCREMPESIAAEIRSREAARASDSRPRSGPDAVGGNTAP